MPLAESTALLAWVETPALRPTIAVVLILAAAISTIPTTNAVVIPVVADTIAFVRDLCALLSFADRVRTFRQILMRTITADTQFVVRLAELAAAGIGEAAVATVPIASPVVVFRVAETVSKPIGLPASTALFDFLAGTLVNNIHESAVFAFALFAVGILLGLAGPSAAVAAVP